MAELNRRGVFALGAGVALGAGTGVAAADNREASLPGFQHNYAQVNGVRLHYVTGGRGEPLVLLPGWPQTWWEYHKIMPALATRFRVIVVDLRGMGGSEKPQGGYDKKTMATDIHELVRKLGYEKVGIAGHDIGSQVAFSFAANFPAATRKVALMDVLHPDEGYYQIPLLPPPGQFSLWWFAFNQVQTLPQQLLAGRDPCGQRLVQGVPPGHRRRQDVREADATGFGARVRPVIRPDGRGAAERRYHLEGRGDQRRALALRGAARRRRP